MAKENYSFDIVSEADLQEVDNAVNQAKKELAQRYDFKGSKSSIEYNRQEKKITLIGDDNFKLRSVRDVLAEVPKLKHELSTVTGRFNALRQRVDSLPTPAAPPPAPAKPRMIDTVRAELPEVADAIEEAIAELKRCSGTQFDPVIVSAFLLAYEKGNIITSSTQHHHLT